MRSIRSAAGHHPSDQAQHLIYLVAHRLGLRRTWSSGSTRPPVQTLLGSLRSSPWRAARSMQEMLPISSSQRSRLCSCRLSMNGIQGWLRSEDIPRRPGDFTAIDRIAQRPIRPCDVRTDITYQVKPLLLLAEYPLDAIPRPSTAVRPRARAAR